MLFWSTTWWGRWSYTLELLYTRYLLRTIMRDVAEADPYRRNRPRASWTYDPKSACYGKMGIEGGIAKALAQMELLYALASQHNIPSSVGVYPWPQQLLYDNEASRQVGVWKNWCVAKCRRFFDHSPTMFAYKREHPDFLRELFVPGDIHYNAFGNEVIARDLISQYF